MNKTIDAETRRAIRRRVLSGATQVQVAKEYGVRQPVVSKIVRGGGERHDEGLGQVVSRQAFLNAVVATAIAARDAGRAESIQLFAPAASCDQGRR